MSKKKASAMKFFKMGRSLITEKKIFNYNPGIGTITGSSAVGTKTTWHA